MTKNKVPAPKVMMSIAMNRVIALGLNILLVAILFYVTLSNKSDKAIILVLFYYPALILVNLIVWLILRKFGPKHSLVYKQIFVGLILLFIPTILIAT